MKNLKSFNESLSQDEVYGVYFSSINESDFFKSSSIDKIKLFKTHIKAADHVIRYLNERYRQNFEPMFEGDNKLFLKVEDNPDYKKALDFIKENLKDLIYIEKMSVE